MKLFPVKICKQLLKDTYNITKGISKCNKQQLNDLLYNCKHNDYLERKKETYYSTTDMVNMLKKDENITQHIMSYIIDFEYYKQMKDVNTGVLS